ncbi:N-acetyltransferase [Brevundimonas sp. NPDC092305]|uniref:N-acetyltransferase n=1 Tax=Brevundimonas sp. NPDC092305 TaxID=3363957 RepID=UPI0038294329
MNLRPVLLSDLAGVQALHRQVGWPARSPAGWRWLFDNPARTELGAPAGWVVETGDGALTAHVGNLVHRFRLGERTLHGATGFSIIVSPAAKGASRKLIRTFLSQPGVFAAYTLNANALSQPIYPLFGMQAWPAETHALKLSWPVDLAPLAVSRALKLALKIAPGPVSGMGEQLMNGRLGREARFSLPEGVTRLDRPHESSRYAAFWEALAADGALLADRSPAALAWRLADPDQTLPPLVLAFERAGRITGYAMAMLAKTNILEPPVLEILDLQALADEPDAIPTLMTALTGAARPLGAAKVRLQVMSPRLLERLGPWTETARREGGWGHCHVQFAPDAPVNLWSPTPWDGDYAACLRPVPIGEQVRARRGERVQPSMAKA